MIKSIEEAKKHASHLSIKSTHLVVIYDGSIYASSDTEKMQSIIDKNECFVLKGGLTKTIKATKKEINK